MLRRMAAGAGSEKTHPGNQSLPDQYPSWASCHIQQSSVHAILKGHNKTEAALKFDVIDLLELPKIGQQLLCYLCYLVYRGFVWKPVSFVEIAYVLWLLHHANRPMANLAFRNMLLYVNCLSAARGTKYSSNDSLTYSWKLVPIQYIEYSSSHKWVDAVDVCHPSWR